ncbi:cilia- and flagella-associated protein 46 [Periophthalmus magnuspinnatus]|uniref:cilia- and flagella-associated protein 46 n=1 Tax=Periophthalmus magnuspinnatus TaxID=409849 RepID=UPI0024364DE6|nr:cilia- and flagella-associated protein 46 [Periophthalmus magnuspinnatus]
MDSEEIRKYISKAREEKDAGALQMAYNFLTKTGNREECVSPDIYVLCAEAALQLGRAQISKPCLKSYFEGNPPANQFLCRAYLCQGQLECPPATGSVEEVEKAVDYFLKAIEVAKNEPRYHCLVFNASVLYLHVVRPLLVEGRSYALIPSLRQVVQSLEEVNDQDYSWRAQLMMQLIKCYVDDGKVEEATALAKVTEDFVKSHTPHLFPELFRLLIQQKLSDCDVLLEMSQQTTTLTAIYKLDEFKNRLGRVNGDELKEEDAAKLQDIFDLFVPTKVSSPTESNPEPLVPAVRVAFLLELALLALQTKHQEVAADCLKELKTAEEASTGQRIIMECISCEISLLKKEAKMNEYSKGCVEARLREIGRLDQWLLNAERAGDPQAMQAVCASVWRLCLPLLQHNLRRSIRSALLRVAKALEDIQSLLLEMRCQVHSELALIEEEEGRLEAALTHLNKALQLDLKGTYREPLSSASRLLRLRALHNTPSRPEEKAATLMQQVKDMPDDNTDSRPVLVAVGLLLAPEGFQVVLDADDPSKAANEVDGSGPVAELCAKAQHHSSSVQMVNKHLVRQEDTEPVERLRLWAALAKTARKQEEWDVCRAACRFCLLYDDGRWKLSKANSEKMKDPEAEASSSKRGSPVQNTADCNRESLRLLAEIHFINAEAVVQKLHTEGLHLNSCPVPPLVKEQRVSDDDADWIVYRDWIISLSAYASLSFLRAAELGAEISESWVVANAAIYLWNYNKHLLLQRRYQLLLPTFRPVVELMQKIQYTGDRALFAMLCNTVARGLIQPLPASVAVETPVPVDRGKGRGGAASVSGPALDPSTLQDARKALELCELALKLSSGSVPGELVPIAVRSQVVSTWVQTKRLLQQQIGLALDLGDESLNAEMRAMTRVLVGLEMFQCNRSPGQMDFSLPALSTLFAVACECSWPDAVVELQVWSQLSFFCYEAEDHSLVLSCSHRALSLSLPTAKRLNRAPYVLYDDCAVNEMLSRAACLRGLSLAHESYGDVSKYREALDLLLSSVRYADKAGSWSLCAAAARHYWNTCLPLAGTPEERALLRDPLENTLLHTHSKHTVNKKTSAFSTGKPEAMSDDVSLKASIYRLLLQIHLDKSDLKSAKKLLEKVQIDLPRGKHKLSFLKSLICVKAQLGDSVVMEMQRLEGEGEQCCSLMWHRVALCSEDLTKKLTCYQRSIDTLTSTDSQWQKVSLLLELSEWMFFNNFPKTDALQMIQWAIDLLLEPQLENTQPPVDESTVSQSTFLKSGSPEQPVQTVSDLRDVKSLDALIRAHTLLAVMAGRTSPEHQANLLRAYCFVIQMWKILMTEVGHISSELAKFQAQSVSPASAGSKKGKDKDKGKVKKPKEISPDEDKLKPLFPDLTPPLTLKDWVCFCCPDQARHVFRNSSSPRCPNACSIPKQPQSLFYLDLLEKELQSLSLPHLTLPVLHLAEIIAHDLLDQKALSELYRLRIVKTCYEMRVETHSPYHEKLHTLVRIHEQELIGGKREILISKERKGLDQTYKQKALLGDISTQRKDICAQSIWLGKAEVCLRMGLHAQARHFLEETHSVATAFADQISAGRSLLLLASLAYEQQSSAQALILLDTAQASGGDPDFWCQLIQTRIQATATQQDTHVHAKIDDIIRQGCEALELIKEKQMNRSKEVEFLITSVKMRGAVECIHLVGDVEPGRTLCPEDALRLKSNCDKLEQCARDFTLLQHREQAAEALAHCSHGLRFLAQHSAETEEKQRLLLVALSQMQAAVSQLEHVALNAQNLLPAQEESPVVSLAVLRWLLRLRLALSELCMLMLEEHCTEHRHQAVARTHKSAALIILEDFTRSTPEPHTVQQAWLNVGTTLGQVALGQLAAVSSHYLNSAETKAWSLCLMGKYLRLQATIEDPIYVSALWDPKKQNSELKEADPQATGVEQETSEKEQESSFTKPRMTSAKSSDKQLNLQRAQHLLAEASKSLSEASSLCLQNQLSAALLSEVCLNMVETHGLSDPSVTGQYLGLLQSCLSINLMTKVLTAAFSDSQDSTLSSLLQLNTNLLQSRDEGPTRPLQVAQGTVCRCSKAFTHLFINPSHLSLLSDLPPNMKLLLLQHSEDRKELYGAFYEVKAQGNQKGKTIQTKGLTCSKVAKVAVCPRTLLTLLDHAQALSQETRQVRLKEASHRIAEGAMGSALEGVIQALYKLKHKQISVLFLKQSSAAEQALALLFRELVQQMEAYLTPLLSQFDFSSFRPVSAAPEQTRSKDKEEKTSSATFPVESGESLVLLADQTLLLLPLEALSVLQEEGLTAVSRDFSLQLLHTRLQQSDKVEGDNKKETKGAKAKGDQSQAIKARPFVLPPNTIPVNSKNIKYVVDPYNDGVFDSTSLSGRMSEILEAHSQISAHLWEGYMGSKYRPRRAEIEQLLSRCSTFIFLGMEHFMVNVTPARIAALNLSECSMALLFDLVQNRKSIARQSDLNREKCPRHSALEVPLHTALLLSLSGVGCIALNQWHSSFQLNTRNMATVLEGLLKDKQTSGQAIHSLRKAQIQGSPKEKIIISNDHELNQTPADYTCVLYGLPNLIVL